MRQLSRHNKIVKAKDIEGHEVNLNIDEIEALKMSLQGPLILPGEDGYDQSRSVWNAMIDRRPSFVVRCLGLADVMVCVQFARSHNLLLCIKSGGHNIAGLATSDGALMLDMSLMRGVWLDNQRKIAHAQAGCLLGDVDCETQVHGLAAVLGFVSKTGIAGLTLGGGFGYLTRRFGYTVDNVVNMDVVTAEGQFVQANNEENVDLFWGLRGGGWNFGVVTGIDFNVYLIGPEIVGGVVAWPASEAEGVLELYRSLAESAPTELTLVLLMRPAPPAPWLPEYMHGKPIVAILACYSGQPDEGEKVVTPIKSFGKPVGDVLIRRPYAQMQGLLDATQPAGRRYYWKSEYLRRIDPALCQKVMQHATRIQSPYSAVILFQLGGALNQIKEEESAVGNRDARYLLNITGSWEHPDDDRVNIEWAREAWADMRQFSTGGTYINFLTEDEGPERITAAHGKGIQRLAEIKAKWDPDNFFRTNRNIKPA